MDQKRTLRVQEPAMKYKLAAKYIAEADIIYITAGAGMGVGSGLAVFRGATAPNVTGTWPGFEKHKVKYHEITSPFRFSPTDDIGPRAAWGFVQSCFNAYTQSEPHDGYKILRNWCDQKKSCFVFTSNIDNHFERAGFVGQVNECHGALTYLQCQRRDDTCPNKEDCWLADKEQIWNLKLDESGSDVISPLPSCPGCGKPARPAVVMFGPDNWVVNNRLTDHRERCVAWVAQMKASGMKAVVIELGAGTAIPTVRGETEWFSRELKCPIIRVNPEFPEIKNGSECIHVCLTDTAEVALKQLDDILVKKYKMGKK